MTGVAGIRNLVKISLNGRDKMKSVGGDEGAARKLRQNLRHVTGHALTARTICRMMGVCLNRYRMRAVLAIGRVTTHANLARRFSEQSVIISAMRIVARKASDAARVHKTLDEIVTLHAVLIG